MMAYGQTIAIIYRDYYYSPKIRVNFNIPVFVLPSKRKEALVLYHFYILLVIKKNCFLINEMIHSEFLNYDIDFKSSINYN